MRPGSTFQFAAVTRADAIVALQSQVAAIAAFRAALQPAGATHLDSAHMLALNLIDGWISAEGT
jgi:hypothetical protein